ncbi:M48 family metallopeptidase [Streptomyces sp. NPDC005963]|uniref:M48 family metallopeptidase n=1 Tax=Streptomyces sp. NPDC005963 TaxID=3156721 RepID=UPI0034011A65
MSHFIRLTFVAALLLSFYLVVLTTVLVWLAMVVLIFYTASYEGATVFPVTNFLFCAGTALLVYALVDATCRSLFLAEPENAETTWMAPREAPVLDKVVRELTEEFDIRETLHIRLTSLMAAEVSVEDTRFLGLVAGNRVLSIGVPLLAVLPKDQVRAVVAHELAHLSLRHHRVRAFTARLEISLTVARESLDRFALANNLVARYTGLPRMLIGFYTRLFRWLVQPIRRRQELEADQEAARICDAPLLCTALCQRAVAEPLWVDFQQVFLDAAPNGVLPEDPFRGFAEAVADPEIQHRIPSLRDEVVATPAAATALGSMHPDLADRLRALGGVQDAPPPFSSSATLVPDLPHGDIARLLPRYRGATTLAWKPWLARWIDQKSAHLVEPLIEAVRDVSRTSRPVTLHQVLHLVEAGHRMPLARALTARLSEQDGDEPPLDVLASALLALVRTRLGERSGSRSVLRDMVTQTVAQPHQASDLSLHLMTLGIDLAQSVEPAHDPRGREGEEARGDEAGFTVVKLRPELPDPVRELVPRVRSITLTVLVVALGVGGLIWMSRDEPDPYVPPGQIVQPGTSTPSFTPGFPPSLSTALPTLLPDPILPKPDYSIPIPILTSLRTYADPTP